MLACLSQSVCWFLLIDSICSKFSSHVLTFTEVPAWLCRIRRFRPAAGRKWHRYLQAAAHHRPLHLLHWPQWVNISLLPFISSKLLPLHTHTEFLLFFSQLQLTWRLAVTTRWWGWCPAGSLSAECLSATGYWTARSCRPSNSTTWKISVSITDPSWIVKRQMFYLTANIFFFLFLKWF